MTSGASLTEEIYGRIREDLIACRLHPGERLKAKDLSVALDVSLGVVREALSRLTAEGFVEAQPQRGFRAGGLSAIELMQLSEATIVVEGFCLRRAIEIGDLDWETQVTATHYRLINLPVSEADDASRFCKRFTAVYSEFRRALVSACDNQWMLKIREMLHAQSERYRQICMKQRPKLVDYRDGCPALVQAALGRDADRAIELLSQRLRTNAVGMREALTGSDILNMALSRAPQSRSRRRAS